MSQHEPCPNPSVLSCFDIFFKINGLSATNFKYVKAKFYSNVTPIDVTRARVQKHVYKKVSALVSCERIPRFQQKSLIVVWSQSSKHFNCTEKLVLLSWTLAQLLYIFYITNIIPSANVISLQKPPWNYKWKLGKPVKRDFIIEPDWNSLYY